MRTRSNGTKPKRRQPAGRINSRYIPQGIIHKVSPGCIVWLPGKEDILPDVFVDKKLNHSTFNHPAVILSIPSPLQHDSTVEIAVVSTLSYPPSPFTNPLKDDILRWAYTTTNI